MTKERYKKALGELSFALDNFNILDKPSLWECVSSGAVGFEKLIKEHFNPQPYKFEDLKVGMWVYDRKPSCEEFTFTKITKILSEKDCEYLYHDKNKKVFFDNMESSAREFEENRFFPVQMANREAEEHERNSVHDI